MSVGAFRDDPWKNPPGAYDKSVFNIRPAPEFATAEVVVASLYRAVGFPDLPESEVPAAGREFDRSSQPSKRKSKTEHGIGPDTWRTILHGVLESPKQPKQSSRRFLQLCPVVPDVALYSGSARLTGNSWNPGLLVERMVRLGSGSEEQGTELWGRLHQAFSVGDNDDIWARWLDEEFRRRRRSPHSWTNTQIGQGPDLPASEKAKLRFPAKQFVRDMDAIVSAKFCMTRRQWVSLVEAILRLGLVAHVLWLCDVNDRLWRAVQEVLAGAEPLTPEEIGATVVSCRKPYLAYGNPAVPIIRDYASRYLVARLGLSLILWHLEGMGSDIQSLSSCADLHRLLGEVKRKRSELEAAAVTAEFTAIRDEQARTVICKKGIGSNLTEFGQHVLGQRQTNNESLRGYDQGYILRKRGEHKSAPWIVSLGPVAVLALSHCCLKEASGPRSVQRLCEHLAWYGIDVDRDDISKSDLGRKLRMLGLVLDSPDAESGMLLVPPFEEAS